MSYTNDRAVESLREKMVGIISRKIGLNEKIAKPLAEEIVDAMREHYGARNFYIPAKSKKSEHQAVLSAFNGRNHADVCKKFGISRRTLYRIIGKNGE